MVLERSFVSPRSFDKSYNIITTDGDDAGDIKDELEYYKNIRYLEVLTQDRSRDIVVNTALVAEAMFSTKYVVYLSLYGFPDDGNFDEYLLNKI